MLNIRSASLLGIGCFVSGLVAGLAIAYMAGQHLDPDTRYSLGFDKSGFVFEKSASASSPFAKCKQRQSALEAIIKGNTADLSRVSEEVTQLQKRADDTEMQFTKEGIIRVPYAKDVERCERLRAPSGVYPNKDNSPPTHCSSLLDEEVRDVQEKKQEYSELQKVKIIGTDGDAGRAATSGGFSDTSR